MASSGACSCSSEASSLCAWAYAGIDCAAMRRRESGRCVFVAIIVDDDGDRTVMTNIH